MDRLRRWLARRPTGRAGVRCAGVTALVLFAVTVTLALLVAVLSHQAWPPVLVSILLGVPALYVAWLAVPGVRPPEPAAAGKPARGRPAAQWKPVELGVHPVIGGGPMPAYIRRPHDELLRAVLDPAVTASRLVVVRGGSSVGKTRAAYEAVAGQLADWQLNYPLNVAALKDRLEAGIPARAVLWLGELRQYADADGGAEVLGRLADLLIGEGVLVITTMWPEQWDTYTGAVRAGPRTAAPAGTAGRLLERLPELTGGDPARIDPARGGVIDVPARFTGTEMAAVAGVGDPVLAEAAAAAARAGQDGQVAQYLAGVPDLLLRYDGPGGDPYGQAVITAAMDATRLGHASLLPAALLPEAAVGFLTSPQRTRDIASWRDTALAWAAEELRGAVRALQPVPPAAGTGVAGYRVADYLDQHGRRTRQDQLGPASLWDALTVHTSTASDLTRLGHAAEDRGLYRHAAVLWTTAVTLGSADAAGWLIRLLRQVSPDDSMRAAQWSAARASLDDPTSIIWLLRVLGAAGASDAIRTVADRAAAEVSVDNPGNVGVLWLRLREAGATDAARTLADRAAAQANLDDPRGGVAILLQVLRKEGASDAVRTLADRAAAQFSLDDPGNVSSVLHELREAGATDAVRTLLDRDPAARASLNDPWGIAFLLHQLRKAGADAPTRTLLDRDPAAEVSVDDPGGVARLLQELREAGATDAVTALANRAAAQVSLNDPPGIASLLRELREAGATDAARTLAYRDAWELRGAALTLLDRNPAVQSSNDNPVAVTFLQQVLREAGASDLVCFRAGRAASFNMTEDVAWLLQELREAGIEDAVRALLDRAPAHLRFDDPRAVAMLLQVLREAGANDVAQALADRAAVHASLDSPWDVTLLLRQLGEAGATGAVTTLADRAANAGIFHLFLKAHPDEAPGYLFGREPDGAPSQSWTWQEPPGETADA